MKGLASHTATSCQAHQPDALDISLRLHYPPAPVSIGAKPLSPHLPNRSSAVPIALRRPIRKVSFSDLTTLDQSAGSDSKPAPSLPRNSDSFSRSYTLKDAFSNRIPTSPGYSLHSEGSETDESKVRGGHLFDSEDQASSRDSLSQLDEALSGVADSTTASPPQTSAGDQHEQQSVPSTSSAQQQQQQQQQQSIDNSTQRRAAQYSSDENDDKLSRGTKTHGGNLYLLAGTFLILPCVLFILVHSFTHSLESVCLATEHGVYSRFLYDNSNAPILQLMMSQACAGQVLSLHNPV
jgi:hypothetical protein